MTPSARTPTLEVRQQPDHIVLRFANCESLDEYNGPTIGQQLAVLSDGIAASRVVIDLEGIRYVTSLVLGTLVGFNRRIRAAGGSLALANVTPFVVEALAITRLDQLLEVCPANDDSPTAKLSA